MPDERYDALLRSARFEPHDRPPMASPSRAEEWDEVDELFRGPRQS